MKASLTLVMAALLASCAPAVTRDPQRYFVLDAPAPAPVGCANAPFTLAPTTAASFYGTRRIVYSDAPGTRANYRFSHWTEPPQQVVYDELQSRVQSAGKADDLVLATRLTEIYHDATTKPGTVHVSVTAELLDGATLDVLAQRRFSRSAPATAFNAGGAVDGMRHALRAVLDDIVAWSCKLPVNRVQTTPAMPPP
ncbi:ABC-type transport auxiliary lipoprotein family protein [Massilia horti]|uniref:ABC-type transport auxiliary lipoprotein component domain-containing protein n=1 Tax=Massilia horti TaxID=2562153 RepID=A0A4Y9T0K8_9BURK|nr:ABC-type transport auxiliary lipoprotein family protein [Massilia horti]TFW31028.1 hypothetical protein E4O92_15095 [Massilia horti]